MRERQSRFEFCVFSFERAGSPADADCVRRGPFLFRMAGPHNRNGESRLFLPQRGKHNGRPKAAPTVGRSRRRDEHCSSARFRERSLGWRPTDGRPYDGRRDAMASPARGGVAAACGGDGGVCSFPRWGETLGAGRKKNSPGCPGEPLRVCRAGSIVTCTQRQVGRLSSVSLLPTSGQSREACNPQIQIGIPYKRCGFHEPQVHRDKHAHRRAVFLFSQRIRRGQQDYSLPSSSSSSSKSRTMKCSYTSLSWSSSSMDSNSSSPFSSSTERRMMMP